MAQLTPNYGLSMPDANDDYLDFRESYNENMEIIDNNLGGGGGSGSANQNIAENYDDTLTYSVGDYVIYNGLLYKCDTAVATAETFDPTKWTHVVVTDEMGSGGSGGHTIVDENGSAMPTETALQFTGNVSVSDDNVNGRTVVDILGGGGSTFGFAIDENNKLFEGTINNFNQSLSYTATEDAIALCYFRGGAGTWQFLSINGVYIRLYGDGTNQAVSYSVPIRKGDVVASRSESYSESCYFLLSVYGIKQGTNGIFAPVIYSDTERKIGVWRDNKPLYKKTYHFNSTVWINANGWTNGINVDTTDVETLVDAEVLRTIGAYSFYGYLQVVPYNNLLNIFNCRNTNMEIDTITLFYTKISDVAGSGDYNTYGVPTVHYDTSEKVIGTWVTGKPLYQKTFNISSSIPQNTTYVVGDITNFDLVEVHGIALLGTGAGFNMPYYNSANEQCQIWWSSNELKIYQKGYTVTGAVVTIRYTKITD